jgi:hypothetical protein
MVIALLPFDEQLMPRVEQDNMDVRTGFLGILRNRF